MCTPCRGQGLLEGALGQRGEQRLMPHAGKDWRCPQGPSGGWRVPNHGGMMCMPCSHGQECLPNCKHCCSLLHVTCNDECTHDRIGSDLDPKPLSAAVTQAGACPQVVALHKPHFAWEGCYSPTWAQQPGNHFQILYCVAAICSSPIPPGHAAVGLLGGVTGQHGAVLSQLSSWRSPIPPGAGRCCLPWAQ